MSPCEKHRRYKGKRKPLSNCEICWYVYFACNVWYTRCLEYEMDKGIAPKGAYALDDEETI